MSVAPRAAASKAPLVRLEGITKTFADGSVGVHDLSLEIHSGEFLAIVGTSGAGKSTLLNILGLLDEPSAGSYFLGGVNPFDLPERDRDKLRGETFGFVFQNSFVLGDAPAIENVALPLRHRNAPVGRRLSAAQSALDRFHLGPIAASSAKLLSGGERQRLATARAVVGNPGIVLADEPTGSLDPSNASAILECLRELNDSGVTVVLITHDEELATAAHRRVRLSNGRLVGEEPVLRAREAKAMDVPTPLPRPSRIRRTLDDFSDACASVRRHLRRSLFLVASFGLGIAGLTAATGMSQSAAVEVNSLLTVAQGNEVRIAVPDGAAALSTGSAELDRWVANLSALPDVESVGYVARPSSDSLRLRLLHDGEEPTVRLDVVAASYDYLARIAPPVSHNGADLALLNEPNAKRIAWIGEEARRVMNLPAPGPGSALWIDGHRVDVVGQLSFKGSPADQRRVFVSRDVLGAIPDIELSVVVRTKQGHAEGLAKVAAAAMDPVRPGRFTVETASDLQRIRSGVAADFGALIGILSIILLALSALSASTTMSLAVQHRKPEIALRRAVGASTRCIARIFLYEGAIVGLIGGIAGASLGTAAIIALSFNQLWTPVVPVGLGPAAILIGTVTGVVSAVVPAWLASRLRPADAIRG
jgi:macrolide transport system ATP-binding/permease protein